MVRVLDSDEIERIPVKGVNTIVSVNAGVVVQDGAGGQTDNATINVRGGRGNETLFIVDGVPYNDAIFVKQPGLGASVAWHQDGLTHWDAPDWDPDIHGFNFQVQSPGR